MSETAGSFLFGSSQPLFGAAASNPFTPQSSGAAPDISKLSLEPTAGPSTSTTLAPPLPAYQPSQYLTTLDEYLPDPEDVEMDDDDEEEETAGGKDEWRDARWEQLLPGHIDEVFERFVRRLQNADSASNQVLR